MIITQTPLRVSLLGGTTDYPAWWRQHGGVVVGGAIDKFVHLCVRWLPHYHAFRTRVVYSKTEEVGGNHAVSHPAVRACLERAGIGKETSPGVEIIHWSDLPAGSGTGSSSSFCVGLLNALFGMERQYLPPAELARLATVVEQEDLAESVGCQDQLFAAHGGLKVFRFHPSGEISVIPLGLSPEDEKSLSAHLLLVWTGMSRRASEVAATYVPGLQERARAMWTLQAITEKSLEVIRRGWWDRLGDLLDQSWRLKVGLSPQVCPREVNDLYLRGRLAGAWGGKLCGAGGGGCLLYAVAPEHRRRVLDSLGGQCLEIPFSFTHRGSEVLFYG